MQGLTGLDGVLDKHHLSQNRETLKRGTLGPSDE